MGKKIHEMSDEEIDGLSPEELEALTLGHAPEGEGEEEEEGEGEGEGEEEGGDAGEGEGEEEEGEGEGEEEGLTPEQLAALAEQDAAAEELEEGEEGEGDMVPRARLNQVLDREKDTRALALALMEAKGLTPAGRQEEATADPDPKPEFDFAAARKEYHKLVVAGEDDEAEAKLTEIDIARDALNDWKLRKAQADARDEAVAIVSQRQAQHELKTTVAALVKDYPFLNAESKDANEAAILAINAKARALVKAGHSPAAAMREAAAKFAPTFAKLLGIKGKTDKDGKPPAKAPDGKDPRSKAALRRNLGLKQPGTQKSGVGNREQEGTLSIRNMTDEQLDKLEKSNPALFAKLRGDDRIPT